MATITAQLGSNFYIPEQDEASYERALGIVNEAAVRGADSFEVDAISMRSAHFSDVRLLPNQIHELSSAVRGMNMEYYICPFSVDDLRAVEDVPADGYSIPGVGIGDEELLIAVRETGLPVRLVTGVNIPFVYIEGAIEVLRPGDRVPEDLTLIHGIDGLISGAVNLSRLREMIDFFRPLPAGVISVCTHPYVIASSLLYNSCSVSVFLDLEDRKGSNASLSFTPSGFSNLIKAIEEFEAIR